MRTFLAAACLTLLAGAAVAEDRYGPDRAYPIRSTAPSAAAPAATSGSRTAASAPFRGQFLTWPGKDGASGGAMAMNTAAQPRPPAPPAAPRPMAPAARVMAPPPRPANDTITFQRAAPQPPPQNLYSPPPPAAAPPAPRSIVRTAPAPRPAPQAAAAPTPARMSAPPPVQRAAAPPPVRTAAPPAQMAAAPAPAQMEAAPAAQPARDPRRPWASLGAVPSAELAAALAAAPPAPPPQPSIAEPTGAATQTPVRGGRFYSVHREFGEQPDPIPAPVREAEPPAGAGDPFQPQLGATATDLAAGGVGEEPDTSTQQARRITGRGE